MLKLKNVSVKKVNSSVYCLKMLADMPTSLREWFLFLDYLAKWPDTCEELTLVGCHSVLCLLSTSRE